MLLFNKKIIVSKHCKERVRQRTISNGEKIMMDAPDKEIRKFILKQMDTKSIKNQKIETNEKGEKIRKIWTKTSKLLVCKETEKTLVVLTYIAGYPDDIEKFMDIPYTKEDFWSYEKVW